MRSTVSATCILLFAATMLGPMLLVPVSAYTSLSESGGQLYTCEISGCHPTITNGVGASIFVGSEATPAAGQTIAEWVSVDDYNACCGSHVWVQTGYVIGALPDGTFTNQPVFYVEAYLPNSDNSAYIYTFHNRGPVNFDTWHHFRVWEDSYSSPIAARVSIDGVLQDSFTQSYALEGQATAALEAHSTLPPQSDGNGHWTGLEFYTPGCYLCGPIWTAWGSSDGNSLAGTATSARYFYSCGGYGVAGLSTTEFEAGGIAPACTPGGGGSPRKYLLPVVASAQLIGPGPNGGAPEGPSTINPIGYSLLGIGVAVAALYGAYRVRKHRLSKRSPTVQDPAHAMSGS